MSDSKGLYVFKRNGSKQDVQLSKIKIRISKLCYGLNMDFVDPVKVSTKIMSGLYPGATTMELDNLAAEICAALAVTYGDYAILAARIAVSKLHKETKQSFSEVISDLYNCYNPSLKHSTPMVSRKTYDIVTSHSDRLNSVIGYEKDYNYNYFGFKTLEKSYLMKINNKTVERPQHMLMRVAVGIHGEDIDSAIETYDLLSEKWFTHATPTLFNAGTDRPQLSSCFLLSMKEDSIEGIYDTLKQCAIISKYAGGVGLAAHCIRASGTPIARGYGTSNGLLPLLKVFNSTARLVGQGGNKRPGAFAIYIEPWHADIFVVLECRKNFGMEESRARDLFYALWVPDLFMERVERDEEWTLMCPHRCPGLHCVWGDEFKRLYERYESEGRGNEVIKARHLWFAITTAQTETGQPYMLYKDSCNRKSNQQNLGTISSSNLCTEIIEYSDPNEIAVCNLASIALNRFVTVEKTYDFEKLEQVVEIIVRNLNKIIEINFYPLPEARRSNERHRPIAVGVQGLADAFILMRFPFESDKAQELNRNIFETIYYCALKSSCKLAEKLGPYETYEGSPVSKGILQPDMWGVTPSSRHDWSGLRERIKKYGLRNSLLVALMPTASTAQILGNCESIEPYMTNMYTRGVSSGTFQVVNNHLLKDLTELGLWNDSMRNQLIANNGSVQNIDIIPDHIKSLYKTVWEIPQKTIIDMAAARAPYIDQSQSLNIYIAQPDYAKLTSMHFYGWKKGLKTGMYYLRTRPAANPIQFSVDRSKLKVQSAKFNSTVSSSSTCSVVEKDTNCSTCGS